MARTNKTQQYAILWLNSTGEQPSAIAKDLGLEIKQVQRVLEKSINARETNSIKTSSEIVKQPGSKDLMIRHTASKKTNSVAIMTKEASEVNDHSKKTNQAHPNSQKNIFRPNG